jgi:hypothetical protein
MWEMPGYPVSVKSKRLEKGGIAPALLTGKPPPLFRIQVANRFGAVMCAEPFLRAPALT